MGSMLMLLCEGTLTSAHTAKQSRAELFFSQPVKENGAGKGRMCEENTHKHTPRIGEEEEEAIGKQSQWGLISNSVNKCKPRVTL